MHTLIEKILVCSPLLLPLTSLSASEYLEVDVYSQDAEVCNIHEHGQVSTITMILIPLVAGSVYSIIQKYQFGYINAPLANAVITGVPSSYLYFTRNTFCWQRILSGYQAEGQWETILPLIAFGYAGAELVDGMTTGSIKHGVKHGVPMFLTFSAFAGVGKLYYLTDTLIVEVAGIFAAFRSVNNYFYYTNVLSYFYYHYWVLLREWFPFVKASYYDGVSFPYDYIVSPLILTSGVAFNVLYSYWTVTLIKKAFIEPLRKKLK